MPNLMPKKGFTLIEILIAITVFVILSTAVVVAINPVRQFAQARNAQRWSAVNAIINAINQNMVDNGGSFDFSACGATSFPATTTVIKKTGGVDLCDCLVPTYLASLPYDPSVGSYTDCIIYDTGYTIYQNPTTGRITVGAPQAEINQDISSTR